MNLKITTLRSNNCRLIIKGGILKSVGTILQKEFGRTKFFIVSDSNVARLHYQSVSNSIGKYQLEHDLISFPAGEKSKNLKTYEYIISQLLKKGAERKSVLVALGGGVTGDMAGLAAATYMRGINFVQIPTTLVGQIDSSIGGKVAVDHAAAKNLIGSFYSPKLVVIDPTVLSTLDNSNFLNGLFEAIKIAIIRNRRLYLFIEKNHSNILNRDPELLEHLIRACAREKVNAVTADPFEKGVREILNFGHTLGHALESAGKYRQFSHGVAVGHGMLFALRLSRMMTGLPDSEYVRADRLIRRLLGRQRKIIKDANKLWRLIAHDKKARDGLARFVLLRKIGIPSVKNVDKKQFIRAMESI